MINRFLFNFIKKLFQQGSVSERSLLNADSSQSNESPKLKDLNMTVKKDKTLLYVSYVFIIIGLSPVIGIIGLVFSFIIAFLFWDNCNTFCNILIYPFHLMIYPLDLFKNMPSLLIGCLIFLIIGLIFHFKYKGQSKQIINLNK